MWNIEQCLRVLVEAPRWLLLSALVFAPWAYGATRPWAIQSLNILLGVVCLLWLVGSAARRRWPDVPLLPALLAVALMAYGWGMALNAHHRLEPASWSLQPVSQWLPGAPGSADGATSIAAMFTCTAMLGTLLFSCELARHPQWRKRIWMTIVLTGFSVALFGIIQKIGGESVLALTWESGKRDVANNFAMFRNRNNAGAWMNVVLPLVAALAFVSFHKVRSAELRTLWLTALVAVFAGIQFNPSRASWAIGMGLLAALGGKVLWHGWQRRSDAFDPRTMLVHGGIATLVLAVIGTIVFLGGWQTSWRRLGKQGVDLAFRLPTEIYWQMVADAGLIGYGPGTFQVIFPSYQATHDFGERQVPEFWTQQRWVHAHQDCLQTLIEWGVIGSLAWAALIGGGLLHGVFCFLRAKLGFSLRWLVLGSILGIAGVLVHATLDFPLQVASIQLYVAVLLGICWGVRSEELRHRQVK